MEISPLPVAGAWCLTPRQHPDDRGTFLEWYKADALRAATGRTIALAQANASVSRAGVVRGVHYADVPPGQAKYVTCVRGAALDVVVDLRVGSPTFGASASVLLDTTARRAVFLEEGLGHAFMALEDDTTVVYLCSSGYAPEREHGVDPTDPELAIAWPTASPAGDPLTPSFSAKDAAAPSLAEARARGALPGWADVRAFTDSLREDV